MINAGRILVSVVGLRGAGSNPIKVNLFNYSHLIIHLLNYAKINK